MSKIAGQPQTYDHDVVQTIFSILSDLCNHMMTVHKSKNISSQTLLSMFSYITSEGPMIGIMDEVSLYYLQFLEQDMTRIQKELLQIKKMNEAIITLQDTPAVHRVKAELSLYFQGHLKHFTTPLCLRGTEFQEKCWQALIHIPYGETRSYRNQAERIGHACAYRAVANANGRNPIAIIVPCHRVIRHEGAVGGYRATSQRKARLLAWEAQCVT